MSTTEDYFEQRKVRTGVLVDLRPIRDRPGSVLLDIRGDPDARVQRRPEREKAIDIAVVHVKDGIEACRTVSRLGNSIV